jgi:hypothetical protein
MHIIFLDIDGVLNIFDEEVLHQIHDKGEARGYETFAEYWCPRKEQTERLLQIANALPDTYIVISSTWRNKCIDGSIWECLFYAAGGYNLPVQICIEACDTPKLWRPRGIEIQTWLDEWPGDYMKYHNRFSPEEITEAPIIESFVILDDESDMEHLMDRLVQTNGYVGLQDKDVEKAIQILKQKEMK